MAHTFHPLYTEGQGPCRLHMRQPLYLSPNRYRYMHHKMHHTTRLNATPFNPQPNPTTQRHNNTNHSSCSNDQGATYISKTTPPYTTQQVMAGSNAHSPIGGTTTMTNERTGCAAQQLCTHGTRMHMICIAPGCC